MRAIRNLVASTAAASVTLCIGIERVDDASASVGHLDGSACPLAAAMRGVERPGWEFFEPTGRDGVAHIETDSQTVSRAFAALRYDLDRVRAGESVPRVILAKLPRDLADLDSIAVRKTVFLGTVLPAALYINERVLLQRRALETVRWCLRRGIPLDFRAQAWMRAMADLYDETPDVERLLVRVDAVPPSLLLAQAAVESGWGTSRFARAGNALFGEYTYRIEDGIALRQATGKRRTHIRRFDHVVESVLSYVRNLNTHPAYEGFRAQRALMRARGEALDGPRLVDGLVRYSTRREAYVEQVRTLIRINRLGAFDHANLAKHPTRWLTADVWALLAQAARPMPLHEAGI